MTPAQIKIAVGAGIAILAWLFGDKAAGTASVDLGTGTVNGVLGGDYLTPAPTINDPTNTAQDPTMRALINQSNAQIAAFDAAHPDTGSVL